MKTIGGILNTPNGPRRIGTNAPWPFDLARCAFCGRQLNHPRKDPPQLCHDCTEAGIDLARLKQWQVNTLPVRRFDGMMR